MMIPQTSNVEEQTHPDGINFQPIGPANFEKKQYFARDVFQSLTGPTWYRELQRVFLFGLLACFVVGAATAIFALLSFELSGIQVQILLTTVALGAYSLAGLCCAGLASQGQFRLFGGLGVAASIGGALFAILTNWEFIAGWEILLKGRFSFFVIALALSHAALLLMIKTTNVAVRFVRAATLGIIALFAALLLSIALVPKFNTMIPDVVSLPILSIVGVLDVLGTIATPILHLATRKNVIDR